MPATLTIRVTATDNGEPPASANATFTLTVSERNDEPIAGNDTATVAEGNTAAKAKAIPSAITATVRLNRFAVLV